MVDALNLGLFLLQELFLGDQLFVSNEFGYRQVAGRNKMRPAVAISSGRAFLYRCSGVNA